MEAGVIPFGDAEGAKDLIRQIVKGTYLAVSWATGAMPPEILEFACCRSKRQAIPAYDQERKRYGVTLRTSPMGADHTAGNALRR